MKTPREILLEQNHRHDSRLESIQRDVIENSVAAEVTRLKLPHLDCREKSEPRDLGCYGDLVENIWKQIFIPARRIWLGYAFIWLAIAIFQFTTTDHTTTVAKASNPSEAIANWKEQQTIIAELTKPLEHEAADRPKEQPPRPRSELQTIATG